MFRPEYCCCAIPLVNVGIYTLMSEQFVLATVAGVLTIATPSVVGAHVPSFLPYIFCGLCFVTAGIQLVGFFGVFKEQTRTFRAYSAASAISFGLAFACAAALIALSGVGHGDAVTACETNYFSASNTTTTTTAGEGEAICNAFAWADVGIMGGLWLLFLVVQGYCIFITRGYSNEQKEDHQKYKSIYSQNAEEFRMSQFYGPHQDAWDHRPSIESLRDEQSPYYSGEPGYGAKSAVPLGHQRDYSGSQMSIPQAEEGRHGDAPLSYEHEQAMRDQGRYEDGDTDRYEDASSRPYHASGLDEGHQQYQEEESSRTPTMRDYSGAGQQTAAYPPQHAYVERLPPGYGR